MKKQNDEPSDYSANGAYQHRQDVDWDRRRKNKVRQQEQNYTDDRVDSKMSQRSHTPHEQDREHHYHYYEYDQFHETLLTPNVALLISQSPSHLGRTPARLRSVKKGDPPLA